MSLSLDSIFFLDNWQSIFYSAHLVITITDKSYFQYIVIIFMYHKTLFYLCTFIKLESCIVTKSFLRKM